MDVGGVRDPGPFQGRPSRQKECLVDRVVGDTLPKGPSGVQGAGFVYYVSP